MSRCIYKLLFSICLLIVTGATCIAQVTSAVKLTPAKKVQGLIKLQDSKEVAIGASVLIKGKGKGTIVDINGNFTLSVSPTDTLGSAEKLSHFK